MIISWNTTQACNISCLHCYRDAGLKQTDELDTDEGKQLLKSVAAAGFKIMIFSGGEPLLRPDIYELVSYAAKVGLKPVIGTNGLLLDEGVAQKLHQAGLMRAGISMDSVDKKKHDWFRRFDGAWERTIRGIEACRRAGLPFQIHSTVMDWNQDEITAITDLAIELGAAAHHIFFLVPAGRGKNIEETSLKTAEYEKLLNALITKQASVPIELKPTCAPQFMRIARQRGLKVRFNKGCLAGTQYCVILPNGDVHPCPYLPVKAGNVRETLFEVLWQNSRVLNDLRRGKLGGACGVCNFNDICGGCRARAYYYSNGDYLAEEPWCGQRLFLHKANLIGYHK